jgi:tetratricopeptide (TPR) repeat protein
MGVDTYLWVAMTHALLGCAVSTIYCLSPRAREERLVHLLTALAIVFGTGLALFAARVDSDRLNAFDAGVRFFLFLGACLCHAPVAVFILLHYGEALLEAMTSPGSRKGPPRPPRGVREEWQRIRSHLESLARDPTDAAAHERLADIYARMGHFDAAVYQYLKAAEWLERGHMHAQLLYKAARITVERKKDTRGALIVLRRIVRLYPKSCFAGYARGLLLRHEARQSSRDPAS